MMEKIPASKKWYCYRHPETHAECKFGERNLEKEAEGYKLMSVVDLEVDERAMKVGGH